MFYLERQVLEGLDGRLGWKDCGPASVNMRNYNNVKVKYKI